MQKLTPGSILVATDGSHDANRAVHWAARQASLEHRRLVVLAVAEPLHPVTAAWVDASGPQVFEESLQAATLIAAAAAALARSHRPGLEVEVATLCGDPGTVLIEQSKDAKLLVLGSRGLGVMRSMAFGSVSASVTKHAQCPVVVCRPGTALKVKHGVLVGADATHASLQVVDYAFRHASLHCLPLTLLHCHRESPAPIRERRRSRGALLEREQDHLALAESIAGFRERYPDVHTTLTVAQGPASEQLASLADRYDLVVIGRHRVDSVARRLTPTLATHTSVMERGHTAMAVVPVGRDR